MRKLHSLFLLLIFVFISLLFSCERQKDYNRSNLTKDTSEDRPLPKVVDQPVEELASSDGSVQKKRIEKILNSLPTDSDYIIVTGEVLTEISKVLNNRMIRIDALLSDLSPAGQPWDMSNSVFETRDRLLSFEVAWAPSSNNLQEIKSHKRKIENLNADRRGSKFRLYGRWQHSKTLFKTFKTLKIDDWQLVKW